LVVMAHFVIFLDRGIKKFSFTSREEALNGFNYFKSKEIATIYYEQGRVAEKHVHPSFDKEFLQLVAQIYKPSTKIKIGDTLRLHHINSKAYVRANDLNYTHPGTSGQNQVFGSRSVPDSFDSWKIRAKHGNDGDIGKEIINGTTIRLEHITTQRNLHSHPMNSPSGLQEVTSCSGDTNDDWILERVAGGMEFVRDSEPIRLRHFITQSYLESKALVTFNSGQYGQLQEVAAIKDVHNTDVLWTFVPVV